MPDCFAAFISLAAIMPQALASGKAPWMRRACGHTCNQRMFQSAHFPQSGMISGPLEFAFPLRPAAPFPEHG
jgi:hypothetical protein